MAWISLTDRPDSEPMVPVLLPIAFCSLAMVIPFLVELANAPWQPAQLAAYSAAPSGVGEDVCGGAGVGAGAGAGDGAGLVVAGFRAVTIACCSVLFSVDRNPMLPILLPMALCSLAMLIPSLAEVARPPWQPAQLAV